MINSTIGDDAIRLRFASAAAAERRVASVATAAHAVSQAQRGGARHIWIDIEDGAALSPEALDDIRRAGGDAKVQIVSGMDDPHIVALDPAPIAISALLEATGKPSDGLVSRWVNRPISRRISALLLRSRAIRPWHATLMVAAIGTVMMLCLLFGGYAGLVAGGLLFQAASLLDGVDGEIARAAYRSTPRGALLDTSVDMTINVGFFVAATISLTRLYGQGQAYAGGAAIVLVMIGLSLMAWLARRRGKPGDFNFLKHFYQSRFPSGIAARITEALVIVTSRDFFALLFAVVIVLGLGRTILFALAGFAILWIVLVLCAIRPILRQTASSVVIDPPLTIDDTTRLA